MVITNKESYESICTLSVAFGKKLMSCAFSIHTTFQMHRTVTDKVNIKSVTEFLVARGTVYFAT